MTRRRPVSLAGDEDRNRYVTSDPANVERLEALPGTDRRLAVALAVNFVLGMGAAALSVATGS